MFRIWVFKLKLKYLDWKLKYLFKKWDHAAQRRKAEKRA